MKVSTVEEMREMDKKAINKFGIKEILLMENAGESVYYLIREKIGIEGKKFLFFCGSGNNGGDGLVAARKIASSGGKVLVITFSPFTKFRGSSALNYKIAKKSGIHIEKLKSIYRIESLINDFDVIVDAIFGTGLNRKVEGIYKEVINSINAYKDKKPVISVDIPSGVNGNTGEIMNCAIESDFTVTFGLPKLGNLLYPGAGMTKKLYVSHISFPELIYEDRRIKTEINEPIEIPERKEDSHKGNFGDVLFIAGSNNYYGAPFLAAYSFLKAGGGYSRLASVKNVIESVSTRGSEIVFHPLEETPEGSISSKNFERLIEISDKVDFIVVGPGLSINEDTKNLLLRLLEKINKPILIDGDGLTMIKDNLEILKRRNRNTILTPHMGEMARLTGLDIDTIKNNKIEVLRKFTAENNSIVVLKGKGSLIGIPDGRIYINRTGNSGMAVAGSGDVLTGCIAAMHGLGFDIEKSVRMGVFLHGYAGDICAERIGKDGMLPTDLMNFLPVAMKNLRENFGEIKKKYLPKII